MICTFESDAVSPDQVSLYKYSLEKLLPNSRLRTNSGALADLFGLVSVAGKDSISRSVNDCRLAKRGPFAAMASAFGIAEIAVHGMSVTGHDNECDVDPVLVEAQFHAQIGRLHRQLHSLPAPGGIH